MPVALTAILSGVATSLLFAGLATGSLAQSTDDDSMHMSAEDGGARRWKVNVATLQVFSNPSENSGIMSVLTEGAVLMNFGCEEKAERLWCRVQPFRSGDIGYVNATGLAPARGPGGDVAKGIDDSKSRVRKRDFDASGKVSCSQEQGQSLGTCQAAAARSGGGDATVVVTFPNGFARQLYFTQGAFVSASATMSGAGKDTDWTLENDLYKIRVDDQNYEIPKELILRH